MLGNAGFAAEWAVPDVEKLPKDKYGELVREGNRVPVAGACVLAAGEPQWKSRLATVSCPSSGE